MKKIILLFLMVTSATFAQEDPFVNVKLVDLTKVDLNKYKDFKLKEDRFKEAVFIQPKNHRGFYPYIAITKGIMILRLHTKYYGRGWIFMDQTILLVDGDKYSYPLGSTNREVKTGGMVEEISDIMVNQNIMDALKAIANSTVEVEMRLTGNKSSTRSLTKGEKRKIREMLQLYDELSKSK